MTERHLTFEEYHAQVLLLMGQFMGRMDRVPPPPPPGAPLHQVAEFDEAWNRAHTDLYRLYVEMTELYARSKRSGL